MRQFDRIEKKLRKRFQDTGEEITKIQEELQKMKGQMDMMLIKEQELVEAQAKAGIGLTLLDDIRKEIE